MRHSLLTTAILAFGVTSTALAQAPTLGPAKDRPAQKTPVEANADGKLVKMIGPKLIKADGSIVETAKVLEGKKNVIFYFTASWCGPCRRFTPELVKFADQNLDAKDFVLVMVGSDRTAEAQNAYMKKSKMPFYAIPFDTPGVRAVKKAYAGGGIPNLVVLDEAGSPIKGSYETDGKYTPKNRNSYIGPQPVLATFQKMLVERSKKDAKG